MKRPFEHRPPIAPATLRTAIICAGVTITVLLVIAFAVGWL